MHEELAPAPSEQSTRDVILQMLADDSETDDAIKNAVLDALATVGDPTNGDVQQRTSPTFLTSISVAGFRGIGRQAKLDLYPAPGLMVVSGRNGSGKSSFAEALELTLTGTSYRWHEKKEKMWAESWRNLHHHDPCAIRIHFAAEGTGPFTLGVDWKDDATLAERSAWTQFGSAQRAEGTDGLGWARPLELWRPVLSYDELGRVFDDGPAALYDALNKLLGLDVLADAEKWLAAKLKSTKAARDQADDERKRLLGMLAESSDERAERATKLLKKRPVPLDEVRGLATGSDDSDLKVVPALRALTQLETPSLDEIDSAASRLRTAAQAVAQLATTVVDTTRQRLDLLEAALTFHAHAGDTDCPVCGKGRLDGDWATQARADVSSTESTLAEYRAATNELNQARSSARRLLVGLEQVSKVPATELAGLAAYNAAVSAAVATPTGDVDLASHLESALIAVGEAAESLRSQAAEALTDRESGWAPLAAKLGGWVGLEEDARSLDDTLKTMTAAKSWMNKNGEAFRNLRLKPVAAQARKIWAQLRQESNVDLGEITLQGSANRRRAELSGSVDGQPTKALSVMSQGELHALALALFLPRATAAASPFRFVVLDDPIQAMDPAKIDGFVQVLGEIAQTHQVIVFSHDDRLASVIRETGVDARLVEVVRESESKVTVRDNINPAIRQVRDVFALIKDDGLADDVKARVLPGLFRMALESAAKQTYYTKQSLAGCPRSECEDAWLATKKTIPRVALAVLGDASADLTKWLDQKPERRRSTRLCNAVHNKATVSMADARDLERTVEEVLALR
ncbi:MULTISPECIES: ATP-binding protein [Mycobacterium]|uniref:Nuclease SbcCD subunit C n=1 Tax=Mycobacterium kiyosense TaxID=2871094 RepID=A0A9P3QBA7_9MYCO|nr:MULTISPECIES: ATP-binding protein [Mycobacterium]BDB41920.1 hypothetical protein IWGMT90018_23660 [Mycobacterium kiyosense]BDE14793.1 hypothetical protein MKCMC460_36530 [Mycobacterium sp. 20KCMC460]GLB84217.1 hypothetical protein SRL2020028_34730 [Mycobacterium kiyosense]GLB91740.1 hypothetical protein SRL2020130_45570 [Mycobacterium kiyosense]GLB96743.1 hypothetical protein SRL2020226_35190 [Mycobacterium kiyosense]